MTKLKEYKMFIDGSWVESDNKKTFETLNPENNEPWAKVPEANTKDVDKAVRAAQKAFEGEWPKLLPRERGKFLRAIGNQLRENAELLGKVETIDTGKLFRETNKQANPRLIVGTPGRINDHLKRKTLRLNNTTFLVLDESDRMLDMGFTPQINQVLETVPRKHQTLLFSATLPSDILKLAEKYLNQPVRISVGSTSTPIEKIKQEALRVNDGDKYNQLIKEIYTRQGSILIFVKTRRNAEKMVKRLKYDDHDADAIHGNLRQNKRDRVIKAFRNNHFRILVGTDVASRGLDIPAIKHVINFDLPQVPEDFIHRIGRTARAGAEGSALSFIGNGDRSKWNAIQRLIDPNFRAEPGSDTRRRRKKDGRAFDRRGRRGKNRFADKKRDNQDRQHENRNKKNGRSFSFKKKFFNKKKRFSGKRLNF